MSGHSKWAKIKRSKGLADAKRGAVFTKIGNQITIAAKQGGGDPTMNFILRLAIDKAKAENMPKDNIQKAIDRGIGKGGENIIFENASYEGMMGGDVMFIIDTLTDNKNRTVAELKKIVESTGGTFGAAGSVSWQFEQFGRVNIYLAKLKKSEKYGGIDTLQHENSPVDEVTLQLLDIKGVSDIKETEFVFEGQDDLNNDGNSEYKGLEIYTEPAELSQVTKAVESLGYKIESSQLVQLAKNTIELAEDRAEKLENLIGSLDEQDDVQDVWTNVSGY